MVIENEISLDDNMGKKVLIIGGGLSGLLVAYRLQQANISYCLIEARERLGGRIHTVETKNGSTIEMGATWFSDIHKHLVLLLKEFHISYEKQYVGKKAIYDYNNSGRTIQAIDLPPVYDPTYVFSKGTNSIVKELHNRLDQSKIHLGEHVRSLKFLQNKWSIETNYGELESDIVINTLPPNLFIETVQMVPELPEEVVKLSKQTHTWMGESIKVGLVFTDRPWRIQQVGSSFSQYGPLTELYDHDRNSSDSAIIKGFASPVLRVMSIEQRKQEAYNQISKYFPSAQMELMEYHEMDWMQEDFTFHSYDEEVFPHQNNGNLLFRKPFIDGHLYFAGSETAQSFPGYMDGAVERAEEVVKEVIVKQLVG